MKVLLENMTWLMFGVLALPEPVRQQRMKATTRK